MARLLTKKMRRNRFFCFFSIAFTIIIGLTSRRYAHYLPEFLNLGLGDALWAVMMYWIISFIFPTQSILKTALLCLGICFLVEFSQLLKTDWLIGIRNNRFGKLVLGQGFLWSDLIAYTIGTIATMTSEFIKALKVLNQSS